MNPHNSNNTLKQLISWKTCLYLNYILLVVLTILNFYGLYSNQFYFQKIDNYIFPLVSILQVTYLNALNEKIKYSQYADASLRNLEYGVYALLLIHLFKGLETLYILLSFNDYDVTLLPDTFLPVGLLTLLLQGILMMVTLIAFWYRKKEVGAFNFDQINENIDSWPS